MFQVRILDHEYLHIYIKTDTIKTPLSLTFHEPGGWGTMAWTIKSRKENNESQGWSRHMIDYYNEKIFSMNTPWALYYQNVVTSCNSPQLAQSLVSTISAERGVSLSNTSSHLERLIQVVDPCPFKIQNMKANVIEKQDMLWPFVAPRAPLLMLCNHVLGPLLLPASKSNPIGRPIHRKKQNPEVKIVKTGSEPVLRTYLPQYPLFLIGSPSQCSNTQVYDKRNRNTWQNMWYSGSLGTRIA